MYLIFISKSKYAAEPFECSRGHIWSRHSLWQSRSWTKFATTSSSPTAEMVFKNFSDDGGENVMAMMTRLVQACECDISVFYTVPPVAMAPLNMGGTLQQQQSGVFVRFYSGALSLPFNPLHYLQHCIRGWFALACVVFSGGWWVLVYRPGQSASCKFRRPWPQRVGKLSLSFSSYSSFLSFGLSQFSSSC